MPEVSIYKRKAEDYADMITGWKDVRMSGEMENGDVIISQRAVIRLDGKRDPVEFLRSVVGDVFVWAGTIDKKKLERHLERYLERGFLIIENNIYIPLSDALRDGNEWVWGRLE